MINIGFFIKLPQDFKNLFKIYPPSVAQVCKNKNFPIYKKIFTYSQEEIEDEQIEKEISIEKFLTPFEYLLNISYNNQQIEEIIKEGFQFFIHEPITFLYEQKKIIIGDVKKELKKIKSVNDLRILSEEDYFDFQNMIRDCLGEKQIEPPNPDEDPRIKRMKAKARYRDKVKEKKGFGLTLETTLASICCMNFGINPLNIGELSYAAIPLLIRFYQEKEKYELDIKSLLAGADSKKIKPKYWIKNLED